MANRLKMAVQHTIITLARQGWSQRRIAAQLGPAVGLRSDPRRLLQPPRRAALDPAALLGGKRNRGPVRTVKWTTEAFEGNEPLYEGATVTGFCQLCNVKQPVKLRTWFLCDICDRVARSIGRNHVAENAILAFWRELIQARHPHLIIEQNDLSALRPRRRTDSSGEGPLDFLVRDTRSGAVVLGIENKTGRSASPTAAVPVPIHAHVETDEGNLDAFRLAACAAADWVVRRDDAALRTLAVSLAVFAAQWGRRRVNDDRVAAILKRLRPGSRSKSPLSPTLILKHPCLIL